MKIRVSIFDDVFTSTWEEFIAVNSDGMTDEDIAAQKRMLEYNGVALFGYARVEVIYEPTIIG